MQTRLRRATRLALILLMLGCCAAAVAQARAQRSADERARLGELLRIRPGSVVADVGAGAGDFAVAFAHDVGPAGHVFATEISESSLRRIREGVARAGLGNVTVVEVTEDDARLPHACCDAVYLRNVFHHLTRPTPTLASIVRGMKAGARLAVIDFPPSGRAVDGVPANRGGHGVPMDVVAAELSAAGLREVERIPAWRGRDFLVLFEKPAAR